MRLRKKAPNSLIFILLSLYITGIAAEESGYTYDEIASSLFWEELYTFGGWTLYCGYRFESDQSTEHGKSISIEHIYPTSRMFEHAGCDNRMRCYQTGNKQFKRMEADMHNMYPVWQNLVTYRYSLIYGMVKGEEWRFDDCDFEWKSGVVEPRPLARGNIARAIFYMHTRYDVDIDPEMFKLFKRWNREDPPSKQEQERNDRIEQLQGTRNLYIDAPELIDLTKLTFQ